MIKSLISIFLICLSFQLMGEVIATSDQSFDLRYQVDSKLNREEVFRVFAAVENWWSEAHTFGGNSNAFRFNHDKQALYEKLENGWVRHLEIVHWDDGNRVVLRGGLGPLQSEPVVGVMTWGFAEGVNGGAKIIMNYKIYGNLSSSMVGWAKVVDQVLQEQVDRYEEALSS